MSHAAVVALIAALVLAPCAAGTIPPQPGPEPTISIADATTHETNIDTGGRVEVTLSAPTDDLVSVHWATADGTAGSEDYVPGSGTLTFAPQQTKAEINVMIKGDALDEPDETVFVDLSDARFAEIAQARGTLTIVDDDPRSIPLLDAFVDARWNVHRAYTRVARFVVHAEPGAAVGVRCTGRGCRKELLGARLRPGTRVVVRVTSSTRIGRFFEYRIRAARRPLTRALCLPLGSDSPTSSC
jgi:hypothetical protein